MAEVAGQIVRHEEKDAIDFSTVLFRHTQKNLC